MNEFIKNEKIQDEILNERIEAQKNYNISSTPTIYINKKKYEGTHDFKLFKKAIEKLL
jgi:protein-disulfide isomerase